MFGPPVPRLPKAVQRAQLLGFQSALLLSDRLDADEVVCFLEGVPALKSRVALITARIASMRGGVTIGTLS